ncbi:MAG: hypothetical protein ABJD58_17590 [Cyclobacteriaceae bacterium]
MNQSLTDNGGAWPLAISDRFAPHKLENGTNLRDLQMPGHSNPKTTES